MHVFLKLQLEKLDRKKMQKSYVVRGNHQQKYQSYVVWNTRSPQQNSSWVEMKCHDIFLNMEMPVGAFCTAVRLVGHLLITVPFENQQCWRCRRTGITTSCKTCLGRWIDPQSALKSCCRLACSRE